MFVLLSAQDVVGGTRIAIVRTDDEEIYYFGLYDGQANIYVTPLFGSLYPRDLMAKTLLGQGSFGAVSLGCDNNEISVTNGDAETAGNIYVADAISISPPKLGRKVCHIYEPLITKELHQDMVRWWSQCGVHTTYWGRLVVDVDQHLFLLGQPMCAPDEFISLEEDSSTNIIFAFMSEISCQNLTINICGKSCRFIT